MKLSFYARLIFMSLLITACSAEVTAEVALDLLIDSNLNSPTYLTSPPGDDRLFVTERSGAIKIFENDGQFIATFITIAGVNTSNEGGLLGLAFDPNYASNGHFFVSYTGNRNGQFSTVVERYTVSSNPDMASVAAPKPILTVPQPSTNHNAGWIGFSPLDGFLYIPLGDGGGGHDTFDHGQNIETLLGSVLRLDINAPPLTPYAVPDSNPFVGKPGLDEIWAYGVRNPWRAGFDRQTGEFYFGDVGQHTWEEVNRGEAGGNFGWPLREGFVETPTGSVGGPLAERVDPLHVYANPAVGRSIVGGVVYRGPVAELQGKYLFAEFYTGDMWALLPATNEVSPLDTISFSGRPIAFGEDDDGDVYLVDIGGRVYRFGGPGIEPMSFSVSALPLGYGIAFVLLTALLVLLPYGNRSA